MEREARGRRPRGGAVGVGGCARLRWSAAGMRSVSSAWLHYAQTLWAVSRGVIQLRGRGTGGSCQLGCLRLSHRPPIAPEFPAYVAPVACSPLIWSPGGRSPQQPTLQARPEKPVRTPGGSGSLGCSRLSRLPPVAPGHRSSRRSSCPCSAPDVAPSRPSTVCGRRTPESALRAAAAARPTTGRFQRLSGMVRISDVPHRTKTARTIPP